MVLLHIASHPPREPVSRIEHSGARTKTEASHDGKGKEKECVELCRDHSSIYLIVQRE